jgi:hypothetical protein
MTTLTLEIIDTVKSQDLLLLVINLKVMPICVILIQYINTFFIP